MSNLRAKNQKIATAAVLAALSMVFERLLAFPPASQESIVRISFGNIPLILAGMFLSPLYGGICGIVSDILGCFVSGYAPYPWLLPAPFITGFLPGLLFRMACTEKDEDKNNRLKTNAWIFGVITITHILSSVFVTTYGLSLMTGKGFTPLLVTRVPTMITGLFVDVVLICILYTPLKDAVKIYAKKSEDKKNDKRKNK